MKNKIVESFEEYKKNGIINESSDIQDDVSLFRKNFKKYSNKESVDKSLDELSNTRGKQTLFIVSEVDDYGRPTSNYGIYKAVNKDHAKLLAALANKSSEIFTTGFFDAREINKSAISAKIKQLENELEIYKNINENTNEDQNIDNKPIETKGTNENILIEPIEDFLSEAKKIKESDEGGLSRAGHFALGLKQVRIVISGDSVEDNYKKILKDIEKHDKESKCEYYEKTGKIVGTYAKAKMDNLKRDLKAIDPKIAIEIKDQKLK